MIIFVQIWSYIKNHRKKFTILTLFLVILTNFLIFFVFKKKSFNVIPIGQRFPNNAEKKALENQVITNISNKFKNLFSKLPEIKDEKLHLLFSGSSIKIKPLVLDFALKHFVNPALEKSKFFSDHFTPIVCQDNDCKTIETDFWLNGNYSVKEICDFINVLDTPINFIVKEYNLWDELIKPQIEAKLDGFIDPLSFPDYLKKTLKEKVTFYSDAKNLVGYLSKYNSTHLEIKNWNNFWNYYQNYSEQNLVNPSYIFKSKQFYMKFNLDLIPENFMFFNGNDLSKFKNQVTYNINYINDKFSLGDRFNSPNIFFEIFLIALNYF
ncbi:hypothetical protein JTY60_02150 [symbiont of Argiope bruennichi]|uniref:hypothetical protein n=1 Tax=symbiont of Argiope bruennichi TaxID=2810479 RepID=UPI003DA6CC47